MIIRIKNWGTGWDIYPDSKSFGYSSSLHCVKVGLSLVSGLINGGYAYNVLDKQLFMLGVIRHGIEFIEINLSDI